MRNALLPFLLLLFASFAAKAQSPRDSAEAKNQVKLNLTPLVAFNTVELSYERALRPALTLGGSVGVNARRSQPAFLNLGRVSELSFSGHRFRNFSILQQLKWYPKLSERRAPHGFYLGALVRYQVINYTSSILFEGATASANAELNAALSGVGVGIEVGYQIKFKQNFLLDFSFFGPQVNQYTFIATLNTAVDSEFLDQLAEEVNDAIGFGILNPGITFSQTVARQFTFPGFRYALSAGYCF
jgi:hypothetical protein